MTQAVRASRRNTTQWPWPTEPDLASIKCSKCGQEGHPTENCPHSPVRAARMLAQDSAPPPYLARAAVVRANRRSNAQAPIPRNRGKGVSSRSHEASVPPSLKDALPGEAISHPSPDTSDTQPSARLYAPPGECEFCDARREAARIGMRKHRKTLKGEKPK